MRSGPWPEFAAMIKTLILSLMMSLVAITKLSAQDEAYTFSHTDTTMVSMEALWQVWTDVDHWHHWDTGLKSAKLNGAFAVGTTGELIPDKGGPAKFEIVSIDPMRGYTFRTKIPMGLLVIKREARPLNQGIAFTHTVQFTGNLRWLFYRLLGKRYKTMLPSVMRNVRLKADAVN